MVWHRDAVGGVAVQGGSESDLRPARTLLRAVEKNWRRQDGTQGYQAGGWCNRLWATEVVCTHPRVVLPSCSDNQLVGELRLASYIDCTSILW